MHFADFHRKAMFVSHVAFFELPKLCIYASLSMTSTVEIHICWRVLFRMHFADLHRKVIFVSKSCCFVGVIHASLLHCSVPRSAAAVVRSRLYF